MAIAAESKFHVLAVDDSLIDRKLIEKLLKTSYQVTTVDSGSKALEFLGLHGDDEQSNATNPPSVSQNNHQEVEVNLIITDYCMPGMTGYDLLKKVKESSSLRNIPVVIMSSENVPSRITRCLEEGAEEFFLKPVQLSDLNRLIPYMMKTKVKNQEQEHQESQHEVEDTESQSQALQPSEHQQPQSTSNQQQQQQSLTQPQQQHHHHQQQVSDNKRKVVEEGLSPDRTRPRYNGIATVS